MADSPSSSSSSPERERKKKQRHDDAAMFAISKPNEEADTAAGDDDDACFVSPSIDDIAADCRDPDEEESDSQDSDEGEDSKEAVAKVRPETDFTDSLKEEHKLMFAQYQAQFPRTMGFGHVDVPLGMPEWLQEQDLEFVRVVYTNIQNVFFLDVYYITFKALDRFDTSGDESGKIKTYNARLFVRYYHRGIRFRVHYVGPAEDCEFFKYQLHVVFNEVIRNSMPRHRVKESENVELPMLPHPCLGPKLVIRSLAMAWFIKSKNLYLAGGSRCLDDKRLPSPPTFK
ncbi:hypothetical protein Tsubulata_048315 [Turnera subulata]|uniref:Uncharacterized protein n=1 Tax=Turnera subulata TaxID=218843 RepID=A0A9Q0G3B5_9ROSI|nr:hypothetical protein Tsubulata_048315 [Turnera subulata]